MNRPDFLDCINATDEALTQAAAMVSMTYGEAGETFRNMLDSQQDNFLWALDGRITAACDAFARLQEGTSTGDALALREALRLTLAALEKALNGGHAVAPQDRIVLDGSDWMFAGICVRAHDALSTTGEA